MNDKHTEWTEEMLTRLEPAEHDFQEFKSTPYLATDRKIASDFAQSISKQISAFANGGGGRLFIGIDDLGQVDGGVPVNLKACGTRSWLEDVIPGAVDPPLKSFNVFEIRGGGPGSRIAQGSAVYVIDIRPSEDAPHQALDYRYYLRIAGKSRPMGNVHIQDVLQRTRHPRVEISRVSPYGRSEYIERDPRGPKVMIALQSLLINRGRNMAHHVGMELILPRPLVGATARGRLLSQADVSVTQTPGEISFFRYSPNPLFPSQELAFLRFWVGLHAGNAEFVRSEAMVRWRIYADDAPPVLGETRLSRFRAVRRALKWIDQRRKS